MILYNNTNLSLLTSKDLSDLIIRKYNNNYIVGVLTESSSFLHKKRRFRPGGLFCEEIFGLLHICTNNKCNIVIEFNSNPIFNKLCMNCKRNMKLNFKRKYRFGSIFLNFPVINYNYFKDFINLLKSFKKIKKSYFYSNKSFKINKINFIRNILYSSNILENKFLNFINLFYKTTKFIELFKIKLKLLNKKKPIIKTEFDKLNKFIDDFLYFKKIFLTFIPVLPAGLRIYSLDNKKQPVNSKLNYLYKNIIDLNNNINIDYNLNYDLKNAFILNFIIEVILNFSKPKNVFGQNNDLYDKMYGKYGIFRQNLLGFRVDYSGRAVIVPGPSFPLNIVGIPFGMVYCYVRRKKKVVDDDEFYESALYRNFIGDKLEFFIDCLPCYRFIVNRAPTLHKINIQSFKPMVVEGDSVKFMPLLCSGYNADFDGDQMGIFSIIRPSAVEESLNMLRSLVNLYSPTTKKNVFNLTQGMLSGYYTLSNYNYLKFLDNYISSSYIDVIECNVNNILIDSPILLRSFNIFYLTTCGRLLLEFNKLV